LIGSSVMSSRASLALRERREPSPEPDDTLIPRRVGTIFHPRRHFEHAAPGRYRGGRHGYGPTHRAENGRRGGGGGRRAARVRATATREGAMPFYQKGDVRIHYQEAGSGFPLLIIPGGGQNSTIGWIAKSAPFNAIEELKSEYRCITADLRNAPSGQSSGPLEIDRPWDSYTDDHLGVMDHLGIHALDRRVACENPP
jgi:hypothetical protein